MSPETSDADADLDHTAGLSKDTRSYFGAVSLSAWRTRARVVLRYLSSAPNTQVVWTLYDDDGMIGWLDDGMMFGV